MEMDRGKVVGLSVTIVTGGLANVFLLLSLVVTWRYWRQVKWYIAILSAANWLELAFRFGTEVSWYRTVTWEGGSQWSCRLLMMLLLLGPSLANMVVAGLSLHVLLTVLTGSQGNRARHLTILGLCLLLSLPLPLTQIPMYRLLPMPPHMSNGSQCVTFGFFHTYQQEQGYIIGFVLGFVVLPLLVIAVCGALSHYLMAKRKGEPKGDEHVSDLILTGLLGGTILICCVPHCIYVLAVYQGVRFSSSEQRIKTGLLYWQYCRNLLSALLSAAFAYLHVYRKRSWAPLTSTAMSEIRGERQKLVTD